MGKRKLRPFDDLATMITHKGEKFVPIQKLASLAFNYNDETTSKDAQSWVNDQYDLRAWHTFNCQICHADDRYSFYIERDFSCGIYLNLFLEKSKNALPAYNQVDIIKRLKEWRFLDMDL